MPKKIIVWGIGWLGLPLVKELQDANNEVICITRSVDKKEYLKSINVKSLFFEEVLVDPTSIQECDVFIIAIPPTVEAIFFETLYLFLNSLPNHAHLIYTSSTGIYENRDGLVDENSELDKSSKVYQTEHFLKNRKFKNTTILRLGGLIGPKRHPVHFLAKNTMNSCPNQVVNLIHQQDVINLIQVFIERKTLGIFNICSVEHPTRKDYYTSAAETFKLGELLFESDVFKTGKIIDTTKLLKLLPTYTFTSIFDFEKCK